MGDKELFLSKVREAACGDELRLFPTLTSRLFVFVSISEELKDIVNKLVNLLIGLYVDAQPELLNKMIMQLIDPLENYAKRLVAGDERMERAAHKLIKATRIIAKNVIEGRSSGTSSGLGKLFTPDEAQVIIIFEAILDLLLPFIPLEMRDPLFALLKALGELTHLAANPTLNEFVEHAPLIVDSLATMLSIPKYVVDGIFALAQGRWADAVDLCRPFCDVDAEVLNQVASLLPMVQETVLTSKNLLGKLKKEGFLERSNHMTERIKQIEGNALQNKGSVRDLFHLVDFDRSGTISAEEFTLCVKRLGFQLNEHRMIEIFSKCKKGIESINDMKASDLNEEEFAMALDYLEQKVATSSMSLLGCSWYHLMMMLMFLSFVLLLIFVFLFLGVSAFLAAGTFSSVINSVMTICAGIGLSTRGAKESKDDTTKLRTRLEEVKDTIFKNQ